MLMQGLQKESGRQGGKALVLVLKNVKLLGLWFKAKRVCVMGMASHDLSTAGFWFLYTSSFKVYSTKFSCVPRSRRRMLHLVMAADLFDWPRNGTMRCSALRVRAGAPNVTSMLGRNPWDHPTGSYARASIV